MLAKIKITGFAMAVMVLSVPMVYADNGDMKSTGGGDFSDMAKILNLSADQEKQLKGNRQKQIKIMKSVFEQMKSNREAFKAEIVKAAPDMNKINEIQTRLKTIKSQMIDNHLNSILEIKKILTPEQFVGYMALEDELGKNGGNGKEQEELGEEEKEDKGDSSSDDKD